MGIMEGKKALVTGVASDRSIAWGIAQAMKREGADIALSYVQEKFKPRIEKLASKLGSNLIVELDAADDDSIINALSQLKDKWGDLDVMVHSIAFSRKEELNGRMIDVTSREGFKIAHDISSYSFIAMAREAAKLMREGGAMLTLTYLGAVLSIPHYNTMGLAKASLESGVRYLAADLGPDGIRVNAISAGPIKTLAAKGISDFNLLLDYSAKNSPLRRNVTIEEVGNAAAFLCSDLASGVNGEIMYVDGGYNTTGMLASEVKR